MKRNGSYLIGTSPAEFERLLCLEARHRGLRAHCGDGALHCAPGTLSFLHFAGRYAPDGENVRVTGRYGLPLRGAGPLCVVAVAVLLAIAAGLWLGRPPTVFSLAGFWGAATLLLYPISALLDRRGGSGQDAVHALFTALQHTCPPRRVGD